MSVDKATLERELREAWDGIHSLVDSVPAEDADRPGVVGSWSVNDLLGHMAFWADKGASDLRLLSEGRAGEIQTPGTLEALDEWNAREAEARRGKSAGELRSEWVTSYEDALGALQKTDVGLLETEVKGWPQIRRFLGDTTEHYREHAEQIRDWLRQLETTEA